MTMQVSYQQPHQPGHSQSNGGARALHHHQSNGHEPEYSRVRSRSDGAALDNYSVASGITDSTLATMKRDLDDSDAASAITLPAPASRRIADENGLPNGHNANNAPLINRYVFIESPYN